MAALMATFNGGINGVPLRLVLKVHVFTRMVFVEMSYLFGSSVFADVACWLKPMYWQKWLMIDGDDVLDFLFV